MHKEQISWCLLKAKEALKDYDAKTAMDYIELAAGWNNKPIEKNV